MERIIHSRFPKCGSEYVTLFRTDEPAGPRAVIELDSRTGAWILWTRSALRSAEQKSGSFPSWESAAGFFRQNFYKKN